MFITRVERNDADTRTWYGEPQHGTGSEIPWEAAYYGGSREPEEPVETEFVSGIERPAEPASDPPGRTRTPRQSAD